MSAGYEEPHIDTNQNKQERVNRAIRRTKDSNLQEALINELFLVLYGEGCLDNEADPDYKRLVNVLQGTGLSLDKDGFLVDRKETTTEPNRGRVSITSIQESNVESPQRRGTRRVLISHAETDTEEAGEIARFIELVCRLEKSQILCTSVAAYGLEPGEDWINALRRAILDGDLIVFLISEAFLSSEFCGFELGAAWMAEDELQRFPIRLPDVSAERLGALPGSWHCPSMSDSVLSSLVDRIVQRCGLHQPPAKDLTAELGQTMRNLEHIWQTA